MIKIDNNMYVTTPKKVSDILIKYQQQLDTRALREAILCDLKSFTRNNHLTLDDVESLLKHYKMIIK